MESAIEIHRDVDSATAQFLAGRASSSVLPPQQPHFCTASCTWFERDYVHICMASGNVHLCNESLCTSCVIRHDARVCTLTCKAYPLEFQCATKEFYFRKDKGNPSVVLCDVSDCFGGGGGGGGGDGAAMADDGNSTAHDTGQGGGISSETTMQAACPPDMLPVGMEEHVKPLPVPDDTELTCDQAIANPLPQHLKLGPLRLIAPPFVSSVVQKTLLPQAVNMQLLMARQRKPAPQIASRDGSFSGGNTLIIAPRNTVSLLESSSPSLPSPPVGPPPPKDSAFMPKADKRKRRTASLCGSNGDIVVPASNHAKKQRIDEDEAFFRELVAYLLELADTDTVDQRSRRVEFIVRLCMDLWYLMVHSPSAPCANNTAYRIMYHTLVVMASLADGVCVKNTFWVIPPAPAIAHCLPLVQTLRADKRYKVDMQWYTKTSKTFLNHLQQIPDALLHDYIQRRRARETVNPQVQRAQLFTVLPGSSPR